MKIISHAGFTNPSFLFVSYELPALTVRKPQLVSTSSLCISSYNEKRHRLMIRSHCSATGRTLSSNSTDLHLSKEDKFNRKREQATSASLYTHPSLLQMKNERIANRTRVYEFLRSNGVVPDELDGLELPVTIEVMQERVDFLHKLGLTIEDINNYPLLLDCSVKKNMIPVLDYLGKLGVRKSTFTEFLHRYPQVLHASVEVDLAPVVKYLQGMDIKPDDVPRVLEKYPEVLGFKLEGTMSTSVAYLIGIGEARREIGGVLTKYPEILGMRVGQGIKPFVEYLESLGIPRLAVARLIEKRPHILGFGLEEQVKPNLKSLLDYHVRQTSLAIVIAQYPEIIGIDLETKLLNQQGFLNSIIGLAPDKFGRVVEKMPQIVSLGDRAIVKHVDFLKECGFSSEQVKKMVVGCPQLLALNTDIMKHSYDYFETTMGRPLDDLIMFPAFFTYGLESTIKPRHKMFAKKGVKCSLAWLLNCSDEKFEERMNYDSMDVEEMEMESSFDFNTLLEPRMTSPLIMRMIVMTSIYRMSGHGVAVSTRQRLLRRIWIFCQIK
ncbi:Mitochondrial transcription termination factor family protein [Forsythia ovata]|uniref:Transcription termination factor MTERF4, chloroplastic n=1 Tax=Forsythia ovata TaxID=205694 RepID=A0ABD1PYM9_9LAMI